MEKDSKKIRNKIKEKVYELDKVLLLEINLSPSNVFFRAILKHITNSCGNIKIKYLFKNIFYSFFIYTYDSFDHKRVEGIPLCYFQHRSHNVKEKFWNIYERKIFNEKEKFIRWLDFDKKKYVISWPSLESFKNASKALEVLLDQDEKSWWKRVSTWIDLYNCYQSAKYHLRIAEKHNPLYFVASSPSTLPLSIFFEFYKRKNIPTYSAQLFNLSEDNMFKPDTESVWINMQCETFYVWGDAYRKFLSEKRPKIFFPVIGHPVYNNFSEIKPRPCNIFCLAINPKQSEELSRSWLSLVEHYCKNYNYKFTIRVHPLENIFRYKIFIDNPYYIPLDEEKYRYWYMINNSTVYYDLIRNGEWTIRYKNKYSFLSLLSNLKDYVSDINDLKKYISFSNIQSMKLKQKKVCQEIFNIKSDEKN